MTSRSSNNNSQPDQLELGDDDGSITLRKAWEKTVRSVSGQFGKPAFDNFIRPLRPLSFDGHIVVLGAPTSFAKEWAEKKYSDVLREILEENLGGIELQLRFIVATPDVQPVLGQKPLPLQKAALPEPIAKEKRKGHAKSESLTKWVKSNPYALELSENPFNDKFTFERFVEGKCNRLALAGATAVANDPGEAINPLFLYGGTGLGKTHLMHAIGNHIRANMPDAKIAYVSGETFTNHYVSSLRDKRTEDFRRAYRDVDLFLVDDIQTIATREQTREEFFHTFNTLRSMNRQIVVSSDRAPRELHAMDEHIRSRFESGLLADVTTPELETRMAILSKKADDEGLNIPTEVIGYMANLIQSNIRALEGALIKLMAVASLTNSPVTKQLASDVLSSYFTDPMPTRTTVFPSLRSLVNVTPTPARGNKSLERPLEHAQVSVAGPAVDCIVNTVSQHYRICVEDIRQPGLRRKDIVHARQVAMYLCRELTSVPMTILAATFGCNNHSTVAHAHSKMRTRIAENPEALTDIGRIRHALQQIL